MIASEVKRQLLVIKNKRLHGKRQSWRWKVVIVSVIMKKEILQHVGGFRLIERGGYYYIVVPHVTSMVCFGS